MSADVFNWLNRNLVRASWAPLCDAQLQTLGSLLGDDEALANTVLVVAALTFHGEVVTWCLHNTKWRRKREWVRACVVLGSGEAEIKARLFSTLLCDRRLFATGGVGKSPRRFHSPHGCAVTALL